MALAASDLPRGRQEFHVPETYGPPLLADFRPVSLVKGPPTLYVVNVPFLSLGAPTHVASNRAPSATMDRFPRSFSRESSKQPFAAAVNTWRACDSSADPPPGGLHSLQYPKCTHHWGPI